MKLKVLGSGSSGNCYILESDSGEQLIIEAGVNIKEVKQSINFDLTRISGVLVSHRHLDHSKYLKDFLTMGIKCYGNNDVSSLYSNFNNMVEIKSKSLYKICSFQIIPFEAKHDVPTNGFLIKHSEMGVTVFLTDSYYSPYRFEGVNNFIIEANYSEKILKQKEMAGANTFVSDRVRRSHMSLENCQKLLSANDLSSVNNIVLIHLSDSNSDAKLFKKIVANQTKKSIFVADKGLELEFNKYRF